MDIIIENATIIEDALTSSIIKGNIIIEDNKITDINKNSTIPDPEYKITGKHLVVLPPAINSHSHISMTLLRGYSDDKPLYDWLSDIWAVEEHFGEKFCVLGAKLGLIEMIKSGTGGVLDFYFNESKIAEFLKDYSFRGFLGCGVLSDEFVDQGGIEDMIIEAKKTITYCNDKELLYPVIAPHGTATVTEEDILRCVDIATKHSIPITIHTSETRDDVLKSEDKYGIPPIEWLQKIGFFNNSVPKVLAHCAWITQREVGIIGENNGFVAFCPTSCSKLAYGGVAPIPELHQSGATVAIGTDGPASNNTLDMFREIREASNLISHDRWDPAIYPASKVVHDAFFSFRKELLPDTLIQKEAIADLCILDFHKPHLTPTWNVISNLTYTCNGSDVNSMIINGDLVMHERKLLSINEEAILEEVHKGIKELKELI